jgi:signal transduction histidine kinase
MKQLSVGNKLYLSVVSIFIAFAVAFIIFQYNREKQYKADMLNLHLQGYNDHMNLWLTLSGNKSEQALSEYVRQHHENSIRVTLIDRKGNVLFDNLRKDYARMANHSNRAEFIQALKTGQGTTVDRKSKTLKADYFYSATYFPHEGYVIRTALPYDNDLSKLLEADQHFIWFAALAILLLTLLLYRFTHRLGQNISKLRAFAWRADKNKSLDTDDLLGFPDDELGEIAERIIKLYRRLQSTRQEQDKLKRELTQNVAHELKTPVASIQGYLETILSHADMEEHTRQQFLQRCYAQSGRLASLLHDISTLNKLDDAPDLQDFEPVDISALVTDIQKETALQLSQKAMTFDNRLPDSVQVNGNRSLLYSVFRNLTDNAIAYAGKGTTILLTAEERPEAWAFAFSDNGVGVPSQHLERLFERFYRVDKGRSRAVGGTGLGLSIVKNAVLLHHGTISVANNSGGGLCFTFTIAK